MRDLDSDFQGAGQKAGIEIWLVKSSRPVPVSRSLHGKFFTGDSYVILKTTALKSGALSHDVHYWLGKDTIQDEAGIAAEKTIELDKFLREHAVLYREKQGHESERFLSYFKPCIIPQEGRAASELKHTEAEGHRTRLYVCRGKHVARVKEVFFYRSSLNDDDIFILDTATKIFQFNGSNSSIQERAKALEVVQYIKDTYHDGSCEIAAIEDGKLMADAETREFWDLFGGFAPLPSKTVTEDVNNTSDVSTRLFGVGKGKHEPLDVESVERGQLDTHKCYLLDCGSEVFVWMGRNTSLEERKSANGVAEELLLTVPRPKTQLVCVKEGFETVMFRSKFNTWLQSTDVTVSEEGRGKVAPLLKCQGVNVPAKEEPQSYIDCTGSLQVWRVDVEGNTLLIGSGRSRFYGGDCYIFHYTYPGESGHNYLVGTWYGEQSVEEYRNLATLQASKIVESLKFLPVQAHICEGNESVEFFSIFQNFLVFKNVRVVLAIITRSI